MEKFTLNVLFRSLVFSSVANLSGLVDWSGIRPFENAALPGKRSAAYGTDYPRAIRLYDRRMRPTGQKEHHVRWFRKSASGSAIIDEMKQILQKTIPSRKMSRP